MTRARDVADAGHSTTATTADTISQKTSINLSGTYSTHQLLVADAYTFAGDTTVNDNLILGKLSDDGTDTDYIIYSDGSTATSSDERQKKNIEDTAVNGIDTVTDIKVRDFAWKNNSREDTGFIAQELKEVYAPAVIGDEDEGMLTISREKLIPVLVKALQEALARIEVLEAS